MKNSIKKIIAVLLVVICPNIIARGGHGGGHGGHGGHHGGGHHGRGHGGHGHHGGHHGHHGNRGHHGWNRGGWNRGGWGWGSGWGFGYPGWWTFGATAALLSGIWYFGGYTIDEWQERAAQNPEVNNYYTTVVQPAYYQYQANPNLLQDQAPVEKG